MDATAVLIAILIAYLLRFEAQDTALGVVYAGLVSIFLAISWLVLLAATRCYEPRLLGVGTDEYRRIVAASFALFGTIAIVAYSLRLQVPRGFVALALPIGLLLLLLGRLCVRQWIHRERENRSLLHRVLVIGSVDSALDLQRAFQSDPHSGFMIIGTVCRQGDGEHASTLPVLGELDAAVEVVRQFVVDTVAIVSSDRGNSRLHSSALMGARRLGGGSGCNTGYH